jgi:uncharacterized membrane protein (UPF0136 family)
MEKKGMKPEYGIAILALAGGEIGYAVSRSTGWLGTVIGVVLGILFGIILYKIPPRKPK